MTSKVKAPKINALTFARFYERIKDVVTGPAVQSGAWVTFPTDKPWSECAELVKGLKAEGFKSTFYRGMKIGIRAEHLA